jgi:cysteine synthase A
MELAIEHPEWLLVNQFTDLAAVHAHRETAREILAQLDGARADALVAGVGSAGHLMGIAPVLAEDDPSIEIVAVQPAGCEVEAGVFVPHELQGLAVGEIPPLLDDERVSRWVGVGYEEAVHTLRDLLALEGLAVGISSAATVAAALRMAGEAPRKRVLTLSYDNLADYPELVELLTPNAPLLSAPVERKERA